MAKKRAKRGAGRTRTRREYFANIGSGGRIPSGIENFDNMIEGGFEKNSTNIIVGGAGSGKTIFVTQCLVERMMNGEKCMYVTFEEKKEQFYANMREFGWDLARLENLGLFIFLEYTPAKVKSMLEEGGGSIESLILKNKISMIVIDSITSFALLFENELAKREAALALFGMIRDWNCTSLLTYEEDNVSKEGASQALEFEGDSIITLYYVPKNKKRIRAIEVLKMRGTKHSTSIHEFEINDDGIAVKKAPIAGAFIK